MTTSPAQFHTRSLCKSVAVWAVLLAVVAGGWRWRVHGARQREAIRLLSEHGGTTSTASALYAVRSEGREGWSWTRATFFNYVEAVDLSINAWPRKEHFAEHASALPPAEDATLELLWTFHRLKQLNLRGTHVTDAGLLHLAQLSDLEKLDISGTRVTPAGLRAFAAKRPQCQVINDDAWELERSPLAEEYWLGKKVGL